MAEACEHRAAAKGSDDRVWGCDRGATRSMRECARRSPVSVPTYNDIPPSPHMDAPDQVTTCQMHDLRDA